MAVLQVRDQETMTEEHGSLFSRKFGGKQKAAMRAITRKSKPPQEDVPDPLSPKALEKAETAHGPAVFDLPPHSSEKLSPGQFNTDGNWAYCYNCVPRVCSFLLGTVVFQGCRNFCWGRAG